VGRANKKTVIRRGTTHHMQAVLAKGNANSEYLAGQELEQEVVELLETVFSVDFFERPIILAREIRKAMGLPRPDRQHKMSVLIRACNRGRLILELEEAHRRLEL
jgi:hypothetical protein